MRDKREQSLFELWAMKVGAVVLSKDIDGSYINGKARYMLRAWLGRSKLGARWIPVFERMPESGELVLLATDKKHYAVGRWDDYANKWFEEYCMAEHDVGQVTHWQKISEIEVEKSK